MCITYLYLSRTITIWSLDYTLFVKTGNLGPCGFLYCPSSPFFFLYGPHNVHVCPLLFFRSSLRGERECGIHKKRRKSLLETPPSWMTGPLERGGRKGSGWGCGSVETRRVWISTREEKRLYLGNWKAVVQQKMRLGWT